MTLHDVNRLFRHWERQPPLTTMVRAIATVIGVKLPEPMLPPSEWTTGEELRRLVDMTNGRIPGMGA